MSRQSKPKNLSIAIVGGGPAALVMAIGLARQGLKSTVFERDAHPEIAPRFNPERSYTIDITGHGMRALKHIEATARMDERLIRFEGIKVLGKMTEMQKESGWTGSRGDILRALMSLIEEKHSDQVKFHFDTRIEAVDVLEGNVHFEAKGLPQSQTFDLIIGADGAGSVVRKAMVEQTGLKVRQSSIPNYATMLELDRVDAALDPNYLYVLSVNPPCVAGAINGSEGPQSPRWFCMVGSSKKRVFASVEQARRHFRHSPKVLEMVSEEALESFSRRECYHIGRKLSCSRFYGGKAVLLGDAASPFPPIGQGVNAAMESAMVLDQRIASADRTPEGLLEAAQRYNGQWQPEAEAVSWISEKMVLDNPLHMLRGAVATQLGISVFGQAKRSDISYSQVKQEAQRLWPFWT